MLTSIKTSLYREAIGGDTNYETYEAKALYFTPITDTIPLGSRYFNARRFGAHTEFDIAKGPEDTAFYLQSGNAW